MDRCAAKTPEIQEIYPCLWDKFISSNIKHSEKKKNSTSNSVEITQTQIKPLNKLQQYKVK